MMYRKLLFLVCLSSASIFAWESLLQVKLGSPISTLAEINQAIYSYNVLNVISDLKKASIDYLYQSQISYIIKFNRFGVMVSAGYEFIPLGDSISSRNHYSTFISLFQATMGPAYQLDIGHKRSLLIYAVCGYFRGLYKDDYSVEPLYVSHEHYKINTFGVKIGFNPKVSLGKRFGLGFDANYRYLWPSNPQGSGDVTYCGTHIHGTTLYDLYGIFAAVNSFATVSPENPNLRKAILDFSAFEAGISVSYFLGF